MNQMLKYVHTLDIFPAYDRRETGHGIHGVEFRFYCTKADRGISFTLYTPWHLSSVDTSQWPKSLSEPLPADVSYHDSKPHYDGQSCIGNCKVTGGDCYSDGSGLLAEEFFQCLVAEGYEGLKTKMEKLFEEWLEKKV